MIHDRRSRLRRPAVVLLLLAVTACTSSDEQIFDDVGLTRLLFVDPALILPQLTGDVPQVAEWQLQAATLELAGGDVRDLLGQDSCRITDITLLAPFVQGACAGGLVLETGSIAQPAQLHLSFTMEVRRARPAQLSSAGDADGDGISDDGDASGSAFDEPCAPGETTGCDDNCPLIGNGDQADADGNGVGDACSVGSSLDSDADGDVDTADNCPAVFNPDQQTTKAIDINVIGDACREIAEVHFKGDLVIQLDLGPEDLLQQPGQLTLLTVDFNNQRTLTDKSCNWPFGVCSLNRDAVRFCITHCGTITASSCLAQAGLFGCPE